MLKDTLNKKVFRAEGSRVIFKALDTLLIRGSEIKKDWHKEANYEDKY